MTNKTQINNQISLNIAKNVNQLKQLREKNSVNNRLKRIDVSPVKSDGGEGCCGVTKTEGNRKKKNRTSSSNENLNSIVEGQANKSSGNNNNIMGNIDIKIK